jgi:F-type H+-transporting ATPase subunit a
VNLTPDSIVYWQSGFITINATLVFSWLVMALLVVGSLLLTRKLSSGRSVSRRQLALESIVEIIRSQIKDVTNDEPARYLPFLGSLYLFIAVANLLDIVPIYTAPTSSVSVTGALAICVFFAVPAFGISRRGLGSYLKGYAKPSAVVLPFNIISELSRTLSLAIRLFGNMMSTRLTVAVLLTIVPFFVPVVMQALGLLIGQIQAYIFAILAAVYIGSAVQVEQ